MEDFKSTIMDPIKIQFEQQQRYEQKHLELQELLLRAMTNKEQKSENETVLSQDVIWSNIEDFKYAPEEDKNLEITSEGTKIYMILTAKIGQTHVKYAYY